MENRKVDLQGLIEGLSPEAKESVIARAVLQDLSSNETYVKKAIRYYEERHVWLEGAKIAEMHGHIEKAMELYDHQGRPGAVIRLAQESGKDEIIDKAVQILENRRMYDDIAELLEKNNRINEAISYWEKEEWFLHAAKLAEQIGDEKRALNIYYKYIDDKVSFHGFEDALKIAIKIKDKRKAKEIYKKGISYYLHKACISKSAREADFYSIAARLAILMGRKSKAKKYYIKQLKFYEEEESFVCAAITADQIGDHKKAKELYEKAIDREYVSFSKAHYAECIGNYNRATQFYEDAKSFNYAARSAEKCGDLERAIVNYERVGIFDKAAEIAENLGDGTKAKKYRALFDLLGNVMDG